MALPVSRLLALDYSLPIYVLPGKLLYPRHILLRQTEIAVAADDQVVVDCQVVALAGLYQGAGLLSHLAPLWLQGAWLPR
jgi:hypothetical protein